MIGFALAEPAIVHHESVDADRRGFFRQGHLARFIDTEFGGFPGVVNHRAGFGIRCLRKDVRVFETMQQARCAAKSVRGIATVENRRLQFLAGLQLVAEIEWIEAAGDTQRIALIVLDGDAPGAGPGQRAEPHFAAVLIGKDGADAGCARIARNREPRVGLMPGGAAAAFQHAGRTDDRILIQCPFAGPAPGQIAEGVAPRCQGPLRRGSLFDHHRLLFFALDGRGTRQDAAFGVHGISERDVNFAGKVFQQNFQRFRAIRHGFDKMQNQIAIAVGERDLQGRLGVQPGAPGRVFLRRGGVWRIEGSHFRIRVRGGKRVMRADASSPIERLQFAALIHRKGVSGVSAIETKYLSRRRSGGILRISRIAIQSSGQRCRKQNQRGAHFHGHFREFLIFNLRILIPVEAMTKNSRSRPAPGLRR